MRHDELLQVVLVESHAIRPICLLHGCDHSSAQASAQGAQSRDDHRRCCLGEQAPAVTAA